MENRYNAVIYARLSVDDKKEGNSHSIDAQIELCKECIIKNNFKLTKVYIDDGYSGTNFERPKFKEMIESIKQNNVDIVIFKDLSRLGRNFLKTSYYIEEFFPQHNIRVISIHDNYDSLNDKDDYSLPIRNYLNARYAKETGMKIRQYYQRNLLNFPFLNNGVYGYLKTKDNKLVIDERVKETIKLIFDLRLKGNGVKNICKYLTDKKVETMHYHNKVNVRCKTPTPKEIENRYSWAPSSVHYVLTNKIYCGIIENMKTDKKYKKEKNPNIIKGYHEPIIDEETFNKVQQILTDKKVKSSNINLDEIRIKELFFDESGKSLTFNQSFQRGKYVGRCYRNITNTVKVDIDLAHKVVYKTALHTYMVLKEDADSYVEKYKQKNNIKTNNENHQMLVQERNRLDNNIQILFERFYMNKLTENEYNRKLEVLKNNISIIEEKLYDANIKKALDENRLNKLKKFIDKLPHERLLKNRLEFIRAMVKRVVVSYEGSSIKFKVLYDFDL